MPDVWAHCPECDRWFYPDGAVEDDGVLVGGAGAVGSAAAPTNARCPVCSVRADRLQDRADGGADPSSRVPVGSPTAS